MPIVWILHVGYAWVPIGIAARRPGRRDRRADYGSRALHALTANAIGIMVLGVASRATLGHTGRPLRADRPTVLAYMLVVTGGLIRVAVPGGGAIVVSGLLWALGYAVFSVAYWPVLTRPRIDGLPG